MGLEVFDKYKQVFKPIPHVGKLPTDVYCQIQLKDATEVIEMWSYSSPQKYLEAWCTLIEHHEDAGRIWPSILPLPCLFFLYQRWTPLFCPIG